MTTTAGGGELARRLRSMRDDVERTIKGSADMREPDRAPLERALPPAHCAGFMWMGWTVRPDGPPIARYKHGITPRYLNLDEHGAAYRYMPAPDPAWCGSYVRVALESAVDDAFAGIEQMHGVDAADPRATPYDDAYRRGRDEALARAGFTVVDL
jgi:hypothetical protein